MIRTATCIMLRDIKFFYENNSYSCATPMGPTGVKRRGGGGGKAQYNALLAVYPFTQFLTFIW
jgi:hypothetical protein